MYEFFFLILFWRWGGLGKLDVFFVFLPLFLYIESMAFGGEDSFLLRSMAKTFLSKEGGRG